jgi:hypothetical protein
MRDTNNGSRLAANQIGTNPSYTADRTYESAVTAGAASFTTDGGVLLAAVRQNVAAASVTRFQDITWDYRGLDNSNTDRFKFGLAAYGYLPATTTVVLKGTTAYALAYTQLADPGITQATMATVAAYSSLAQNCELYDYAQYWLQISGANMEAAVLGSQLISADGQTMVYNAKNLTLNASAGSVLSYATGTITAKASSLTTCAKFNSHRFTTGIFTGSLTAGGAYAYTGGTLTTPSLVPTLAAGTLNIGAAGTYGFSSTGTLIVKPTPTAPGSYTINGTHTGTLDLRNQAAHAITINLPSGTSYTTANNTGGTITVVVPVQTVTVTSDQANSLIQIFTTGTQTVLASTTGVSLAYEHSDETVDIEVQKAGYLPQRTVGVALSGDMSVGYNLAVDYNYNPAHGLTYTTDASWSRANNQLTVPTFGPSVRDVYSLMIDSFIAESSLRNTDFHLSMNGPTTLFFTDGAEGASDATITNMTGGGVRYLSGAGAATAEWSGFISLGVVAGSQVEYEQTSGGTVYDARATGNVNELIKCYGDATHGNFDRRDHMQFKVQRNGYRQAESDVLEIYGIAALTPTIYVVSLPMATIDGLTLGDPGATGLSLTDDSASPVSWDAGDGAKDYSVTVTDATANSGDTILRWLNYNLSLDATFQGKNPFYWPEMVLDNGAAYETLRGVLHNTPDHVVGVRVIRTGGTPHPDFTRFQADDGTYGTPPTVSEIDITGAVSGTRILVRNETTDTVMSNAIGTGYSDTYVEGTDFTTGDTYSVTVTHVDKLEQVYTGIVSASGFTVIITQQDDDVYISKGFDGSTFTGITFNTSTIDLDLDGSEDPVVLWGETYARYKYSTTTSSGIQTLLGAMFAKDAANYLFSNAVVINNLNATPVIIGGDGYAYRRDGGTMFGTGNIQIDNSIGVLIVETGVSGLTPSESSKLLSLDTDAVNVTKMNSADVIGTGTTGDSWRGVGVAP